MTDLILGGVLAGIGALVWLHCKLLVTLRELAARVGEVQGQVFMPPTPWDQSARTDVTLSDLDELFARRPPAPAAWEQPAGD